MRVVPWLLCLVLVGSTMGLSQPNLPDPDTPGLDGGERLATLIARADLERQRHGTSRARFERIEKGPLVLEPEISCGIFSYGEGGRSRWDFESPEAMTVWVGFSRLTASNVNVPFSSDVLDWVIRSVPDREP